MKGSLLDLSGKIDEFRLGIFEAITRVANSLGVPFIIVGATARDMILSEGYGIETGRATMDIDFGVQVQDWSIYEHVKATLLKTGKFKPDKKQAQRLLYDDQMPIDIIPFGAIAGPDQCLSWPHEHGTSMSTLGFDEVYVNSITVRMRSDPVLDIRFVSVPGLVLLKIISWNDNQIRSGKDAHDLLLLMRKYLDAGNQERLWSEETDLMGEDFDYERAGSRLLGRDIARILGPGIKEAVLGILEKETGEQSRYRLIENMMRKGAENADFEKALQLLKDLKSGISEGLQR
jgi:predicted nucleotidyltransferase